MAKYRFIKDDSINELENIKKAILGVYGSLNTTFQIGDPQKLFVKITPMSKRWKYDFNSPMHMKEVRSYTASVWHKGREINRFQGDLSDIKSRLIYLLQNPIFRKDDNNVNQN